MVLNRSQVRWFNVLSVRRVVMKEPYPRAEVECGGSTSFVRPAAGLVCPRSLAPGPQTCAPEPGACVLRPNLARFVRKRAGGFVGAYQGSATAPQTHGRARGSKAVQPTPGAAGQQRQPPSPSPQSWALHKLCPGAGARQRPRQGLKAPGERRSAALHRWRLPDSRSPAAGPRAALVRRVPARP